ncbi:hypothetical protein [Chryseobacterium sp. MMS23-Vi53]|uniref:hypothetical protein n=1 Tax=Chryseobacterium sp. MMS23-Vi53 TaxID=3386644 RepID=UPI0039EA6A3D
MKNIIKFFIFFLTVFTYAQKLEKDSLHKQIKDIETVVINDRDYEKIAYSFALKKEINSRLRSINPNSAYEMGLRFNNNLGKKGILSNVILFLHKTDSEGILTDLEINIYKIDTLTNKPGEKLNKEQIVYTPKTKKRGNVKINIENFRIPFPIEGVVVTIKWLPTKAHDKAVGPAIRLTNYTERLTYTRFDNDTTKWSNALNFSTKNGVYTNVMMGLEVYIKKRKNNE